jgi:hypothetical protein
MNNLMSGLCPYFEGTGNGTVNGTGNSWGTTDIGSGTGSGSGSTSGNGISTAKGSGTGSATETQNGTVIESANATGSADAVSADGGMAHGKGYAIGITLPDGTAISFEGAISIAGPNSLADFKNYLGTLITKFRSMGFGIKGSIRSLEDKITTDLNLAQTSSASESEEIP